MKYTVPRWIENNPSRIRSEISNGDWKTSKIVTHVIVSDDASDERNLKEYEARVCGFDAKLNGSLDFIANRDRLGIAKNKNKCIERLYNMNCDYYFLFDEDCYPSKYGWEMLYIKAHEYTGIHHMIFNVDGLGGISRGQKVRNIAQEWTNCTGVMMFFTRHVVEGIGGFDPVFNIYGYEHANFSLRAHAAGFHNGYGEYIVPLKAEEYLESIDFFNHPGKPPHEVLQNKEEYDFKSSIHGEPTAEYIEENREHLCPKSGDYYRDFRTKARA